MGSICFGDFDGDGLTEMGMATSDGVGAAWGSRVYFMENTAVGVDSYATTWKDTMPTLNAHYGAAAGRDMDGDGKPEAVFLGGHNLGWRWAVVVGIFEAAGDNVFERTSTINLRSSWLLGLGDVACGDLDLCGRDELCITTCESLFVYKAMGNDNYQRIFAVRTGTEWYHRLQDATLLCFDMNQNGYPELIISGYWDHTTHWGWETRIYEAMGEVTFDSMKAPPLDSGIAVEWFVSRQFANYGFEVKRAFPGDGPYQTVHATYDTVRLDSLARSFLFFDSTALPGVTYYYYIHAKTLNCDTINSGWDSATVTGVAGGRLDRWLPSETLPYSVSPNPFKKMTTIKYHLARPGPVNLSIYNILGQLVSNIVDGPPSAGFYQAAWCGREQNGSRVAPGVYILRLQTGDCCKTKRLVLIE